MEFTLLRKTVLHDSFDILLNFQDGCRETVEYISICSILENWILLKPPTVSVTRMSTFLTLDTGIMVFVLVGVLCHSAPKRLMGFRKSATATLCLCTCVNYAVGDPSVTSRTPMQRGHRGLRTRDKIILYSPLLKTTPSVCR